MDIFSFKRNSVARATDKALSLPLKTLSAAVLASALICTPTFAAQKGAIKGKVSTEMAGASIEGVTVTASSDVMPKDRSVLTQADGSFNLPLLIPGDYTLTVKSSDGTTQTIDVVVQLDQTSRVNFSLTSGDAGNVLTIMGSGMIIREGDSALSNSISSKEIKNLPVGTEYRDLLKLIPGVQYSEYSVLGPSAGGSGRDNKYGFDGVDVSLPMFGNLASEPSTHDVQNVSVDRGGAKAVGFNRSGGFAINTISKSGTNEFHGNLEYKLQDKSFVADKDDAAGTEYTLDKNWITASLGGPIIEDALFFYTSYYRPESNRVNKETAYGEAKDFQSVREEFFGKLTYAPTDELLFNLSIRTSDNIGTGLSVGSLDHDSTSAGNKAFQDIYTFEASYIISDRTTIDLAYSEFNLETSAGPDNLLSVQPVLGGTLDINALEQMGLFRVPTLQTDNPDYDNAAAQALIDQYGYIDDNGVRRGGGSIGGDSTINSQDFYRDSFELSLDHEMDLGGMTHYIHLGYMWKEGTEVLSRTSNGWGSISFVGGDNDDDDLGVAPIYYRSRTQQMSLLDNGAIVPGITSINESTNFEINDTIEDGDFTYNIGVLISQDTFFGQGLRENSANVSGYELAPGNKYEMYHIDWQDMIQPRLGMTWRYNGEDSVFVNIAKYNPEASSLARAASWARNTRRDLQIDFDIDGNFIQSNPAAGSSGKFFQEGIKPRQINELTIGTTKQVTDDFFVRAHLRRREGEHFWEDTWNNSRLYGEYGPFGGVPEDIAALGPYIPELSDYRAEVGGSSYVIAELDNAYTSYNEFSIEAEYSGDRTYLKASFVWNKYYGNFDQDSVSSGNDANLFIGSSNLADGRGRQLWDGKEGNLLGDKPHVLKVTGYYTTDWDANVGFFLLFQAGDVWEAWDGREYGYSSSTIRFSEPAGTRRSPNHWQLDLNYTQDFEVSDGYTVEFRADMFNVFDNQTGYRYNPYVTSSTFGQPRSLFNPRRLQLSVNIGF